MLHRSLVFIALACSVALLSASGTGESASVLTPVPVTEPMADGFGQGMTARPDGVEVRWVEFDNDLPSFYSRTSTDFGQTYAEPEDITAKYDHRSPSDDDLIFSYAEETTNGHIYQSWTDGGILFRRSDDDGVTWTQPVLVDNYVPFFEAAITANGEDVFVVWQDLDSNLFGRSSGDAGVSWGPMVEFGDFGNATWDILATASGGLILADFGFESAVITTYPSGDLTAPPLVATFDTSLPLLPEKGVSGGLQSPEEGVVVANWHWNQGDHHQEMFTATVDDGQSWRPAREVWKADVQSAITTFAVIGDTWYFVWAPIEGFDLPSDIYYRAVQDNGADLGGQVHLSSTESFPGSLDATSLAGRLLVSWISSEDPESPTLSLASIASPTDAASISRFELGYQAGGTFVVPSVTAAPLGGVGSPLGYIYWHRRVFAGDEIESQQIYAAPIAITGDTDCSGAITGSDVSDVLREVAGLPGLSGCQGAGDVDCDGERTLRDALIVLYSGASLPHPYGELPCARVGT